MVIEFVARHFNCPDNIREYAEKEVEKFKKINDRAIQCQIILEHEHNNHTTEINLSIPGNKIFAKTSYSATANIKGSKIYDGNSTAKVVANVRNGYLCSENSSSKICKIRDIHNTIEGPGEEVKAALWFYFCK